MVPSQLSSTPLHFSGLGVPGVHVCGTPPTQFSTTTWQMPSPHVVDPSPSSFDPLQSLSSPSHTSAEGVTSPTHGPHAPMMSQVDVPPVQTPIPSVAGSPV